MRRDEDDIMDLPGNPAPPRSVLEKEARLRRSNRWVGFQPFRKPFQADEVEADALLRSRLGAMIYCGHLATCPRHLMAKRGKCDAVLANHLKSCCLRIQIFPASVRHST